MFILFKFVGGSHFNVNIRKKNIRRCRLVSENFEPFSLHYDMGDRMPFAVFPFEFCSRQAIFGVLTRQTSRDLFRRSGV